MTITIETTNMQEVVQILKLLKSLNIKNINIKDELLEHQPSITKGNKKLNPKALFGIWQENPRSFEEVRNQAWKRNWEI